MNDAEIIKQAFRQIMEGEITAARSTLQKSTTPSVQEFAKRCVGDTSTNVDQIYALREDIMSYGRRVGIRI